MTKKFKGNENYSLRDLNCSSSHEIKVPIDKVFPILSYTPPFKSEESANSIGSYCMLGMEKVDKWFDKFKVKHYYIINIKIQ